MLRIFNIALQPLRTLPGRISDPKGRLRAAGFVCYACVVALGLQLARCEILSPSSDACDEAISPPDGPVGSWEFLGLRGEDIVSVAVDPCDPSTILAGSLFDFSGGRSGKLLRSADAGKTWDTLRFGGNYLQVLFDHNDPNIVYASVFPTLDAQNYGVLKSTNGGRTWTFVNEGLRMDSHTGVTALAIDPENSQLLYAGTGGRFGGWLFRSDNGGRRWVPVEEREDTRYMVGGVLDIAFDPNEPSIMYVPTGGGGPVLKSTDRGTSWKETGMSGTNLPGLVDKVLVVRGNRDVLYAAVTWGGVYRSVDGGEAWAEFNVGLPDSLGATELEQGLSESDVYVFAASPEEGRWVYELDAATRTWSKLGLDELQHLEFNNFLDMFFDKNSNMLYLGADGLYRYRVR